MGNTNLFKKNVFVVMSVSLLTFGLYGCGSDDASIGTSVTNASADFTAALEEAQEAADKKASESQKSKTYFSSGDLVFTTDLGEVIQLDSEGKFIRKWVKELKDVPNAFIHEPWKMTDLDQQFLNLKIDYPKPKIDLMGAAKKARQKIWGHRKNDFVKKENKRIIITHTRNNAIHQR